jgi:hypothetical protein
MPGPGFGCDWGLKDRQRAPNPRACDLRTPYGRSTAAIQAAIFLPPHPGHRSTSTPGWNLRPHRGHAALGAWGMAVALWTTSRWDGKGLAGGGSGSGHGGNNLFEDDAVRL